MSPLPPLVPTEFPAAFEALHGYLPFPWQTALAEKVCREGRWPKLLDLPTAAGKTAALDIALFHLAVEADKGEARRAPLRIALVVDRRIVVDDAYARAELIVNRLRDAPAGTVLARMAVRLRHLAGADAAPVLAHRLRGGLPLEADWARSPRQPLLIASTVDQIGSRLLFRGYGVSDRMKPVHAGLVGSDCLILTDEAHLAQPFRQTLEWVAHYRKGTRESGADPWGFVTLTATPGEMVEDRFGLTDVERHADPEGDGPASRLRKRLVAGKPARLLEPSKDLVPDIANETSSQLERLRSKGCKHPAIGVIVNRVARAREVFESLRQAHAPQEGVPEPTVNVELLIGPSRPLDRVDITARLSPIRTGATRSLARPLIVVATQCLEVGADLDFDGLVTECAALDALRQRFGRLNRAGRDVSAEAAILVAKSDLTAKARKDGDPVYGGALAAVWDWLQTKASDGAIDFAIEAMSERLDGEADIGKLLSAKPNAPVLCPAHLDLLLQTSPLPEPDLDIGLFLHGPQRAAADVSLVWRGDLTSDDLSGGERTRQYLETLVALPPRMGEVLRIPIWAARRLLWLSDTGSVDGQEAQPALADAPQKPPEDDQTAKTARRALRWAGPDSERTGVVSPDEVSPGDTLLLPAVYGGCDDFGWAPESRARVADLADRAAEPYRKRTFAVRLHPDLLTGPPDGGVQRPSQEWLSRRDRIAATLSVVLADAGEAAARAVRTDLLDRSRALGLREDDINRLKALSTAKGRLHILGRHIKSGDGQTVPFAAVLVAARGLKVANQIERASATPAEEVGTIPSTEDDAIGLAAETSTLLDMHCRDVEDLACSFAVAQGLAQLCVRDLGIAGHLHDAGKVDPRFQRLLAGGQEWNRPDDQRILAKSARLLSGTALRAAWSAASLPDHWRHEALSVGLAPRHQRFNEVHDKSLVLYLIGTHHGYGRPWFPHADEVNDTGRLIAAQALGMESWQTSLGPQHAAFDCDGLDWPALVATLCAAYGPWRLALMEAILRLADHRASTTADEAPSGEAKVAAE